MVIFSFIFWCMIVCTFSVPVFPYTFTNMVILFLWTWTFFFVKNNYKKREKNFFFFWKKLQQKLVYQQYLNNVSGWNLSLEDCWKMFNMKLKFNSKSTKNKLKIKRTWMFAFALLSCFHKVFRNTRLIPFLWLSNNCFTRLKEYGIKNSNINAFIQRVKKIK